MVVKPLNSLDGTQKSANRLTRAEFKAAISGDKPAVIDFWATWCGPCKAISPVFEKLSGETDGVAFYKVDVDEQADIAQECGISAMPTFIYFKNGEKVDSVRGAYKDKVVDLVKTASSA